MKISYDTQIFCSQTYGGVSRYFCEIASRLFEDPGLEISIAAPLYINSYLPNLPSGIVTGFRAPRVERFNSKYLKLLFRGAGLMLGDIALRTQCPDIVHETYYFAQPLGPRHARRVLTIYDMIHERFPSDFPLADKTSRYKAAAAKRADHVICISEATRADVIEFLNLPPEKISVIHLGFDLMKPRTEAFAKLGGKTDGPFLLYVGNRGGYKNFLRLLDAYASSPTLRYQFKLVCFGGGPFSAEEREKITRLHLTSDQVVQFGGNDEILSGLYARASAFVYPSLYEGFGIPPLEAMSHGCPVVCAATSSIPEVVGNGGEYFDPADIGSIRESIERVVGSESHRDVLVRKGRARLDSFSWDRCAHETLNVYRRLA
ncbi:glycosyltransferase family 1 protein [Roseovarius sp. 10]|uniref:glycosyltransferase family 4 protein n=1 Tax=Roseovarius sp. 10 TaxID=3080563 RepID=UPI0029541BB7|nr:glycosyltransferase family 1 protein [Roseovarius sp. 10]MDV7199727.1 glycosyltransferase family 1 protein [Roseovarius sp. 10]